MAQKELEKTRGEEFWELINWARKNSDLIPKNIEEKIQKLICDILRVMHCPTVRSSGYRFVDYKKAMATLKNLLKKCPKQLPPEIRRKLNKAK